MKKILTAIILAALLFLSFWAGCRVTIRCAVPCCEAQDMEGNTGYLISYRYGGYWRNEFYSQTLPEKAASTAHPMQ